MKSTPEHMRFASIPGCTIRADFAGGGLSSDLGAQLPIENITAGGGVHIVATVFRDLLPLLLRLSSTADSNLISFSRLCRSAIDHHRHSTNTGQYAIGAGGQFGVGVNTPTLGRRNFGGSS